MSYVARDVNGYLGDVASLGGWATFAEWAALQTGRPALAALLEEGWADAALLLADLEAKAAPGDAESTRAVLAVLARKAEDILLVTDGVEDDGAPPEEA